MNEEEQNQKIKFRNVYITDLIKINENPNDVKMIQNLVSSFIKEFVDETKNLYETFDRYDMKQTISTYQTNIHLLTEKDINFIYNIEKAERKEVIVPLTLSMIINGGTINVDYSIISVDRFCKSSKLDFQYNFEEKQKTYELNIPKGIEDNAEIEIRKSKGNYQENKRRGDIVFISKYQIPPQFDIQDHHIVFYCKLENKTIEAQKTQGKKKFSIVFNFYEPFFIYSIEFDQIKTNKYIMIKEDGGLFDKEQEKYGSLFIYFYQTELCGSNKKISEPDQMDFLNENN